MEEFCELLCSIQNNSIFQLVAGAILAIITTITIDILRKPKIILGIEDEPTHDDNFGKRKHLRFSVQNKNTSWFLRWLTREPAVHCCGFVTFLKLDNNEKILSYPISIRWDSLPQPVIGLPTSDGILKYFTDSIFDFNPKIDIYPGETEKFTFTIKFDNDEEFYAFNNESYFTTNFRKSGWGIYENDCYAEIEIRSSTKTIKNKFRILNQGGIDGFTVKKY